jgi:hypothetical protein
MTQAKQQPVKLQGKEKKELKTVATIQGAAKSKKQSDYKATDYYKQVIEPNRFLKEETSKIGYCIKQLLNNSDAIKLQPDFIKLLKQANKDEAIYKQFANEVRKSKTGKYSPFALLQYLYKIA